MPKTNRKRLKTAPKRNPKNIYKKPSKEWKAFMHEDLQGNSKAVETKEKSTLKRILKLIIFFLIGGAMALFGFILLTQSTSFTKKYNLTVEVYSGDNFLREKIPVTKGTVEIRTKENGETVAKKELTSKNKTTFKLKEGKYTITLKGGIKGEIDVQMNMDRTVELKAYSSSF